MWRTRTTRAAQPLVWRLDRAASRFDSKQIQLVYATESPRLKLVWRWRARRRYALKFQDQGAAANRVQTGEVLMQQGVAVTLKRPLSSELVFFEQVHSGDTRPGVTTRSPGM